jgi:hypothetical protein
MDKAKKSAATIDSPAGEHLETASQPYVGRWNRLVSTTNWEKGRIICEWRDSLEKAGEPPREFSDDAWSRLVGCVTAQHVGRLRRVHQRFGKIQQTFEGLYWSHFQAAIDWDDAEMYLEGAVQNGWSVSQMRRTRWESMGAVAKDRPRDGEVVTAELDEDFETSETSPPESETLKSKYGEVSDPGKSGKRDAKEKGKTAAHDRADQVAAHVGESAKTAARPVRPFEQLAELPEDVAEAFEQMKLAILRHKADGWTEITCDELLAALDSLKELALAPSASGTK